MLVAGINFSYDSAAAVMRDGRVIAAAAEERFSRKKHDSSFPTKALAYGLQRASASPEDVGEYAFFWNAGRHAEPLNWRQSQTPRHHLEFLYNVPNHLLHQLGSPRVGSVVQRFELPGSKDLTIRYVDHHLCHAASAFFRSPFEEAAILTLDGYGERASAQIARGRGNEIEVIREVEFPHSIGSVYAATTQFLGFRANNGEGKVMGLASYGKPTYVDHFRRWLRPEGDGVAVDLSAFAYFVERGRRWAEPFEAALGPPRRANEPLEQRHMDIAHSLQVATEEAVVHLARVARRLTDCRAVAIAGGVALNCVANARITTEAGFSSHFIQPAAGDSGTALGAALWVSHGVHGIPRVQEGPVTDYLGPEATDSDIQAELRRANLPAQRLDDAPADAASAIERGEIIGWFQGRAEYGPRALGNRSILADPRRADMVEILNARVKFREPFRPFAPSVLEERCSELFERGEPSPYMLLVYRTREDKREVVPAITHVDGGARVQTVNAEQNPRYHQLISAFYEQTGVPCVLNTSFNIRGEPIVNSVSDALKCFYTTDMDRLYVGDWRIDRPR